MIVRVTTDKRWSVVFFSRDKASVHDAYFELRRHMRSETYSADAAPLASGGFYAGRTGTPYRAWSTAELANTLNLIPSIRAATLAGMPLSISADPSDVLAGAAAIEAAAGTAVNVASLNAGRAVDAAGDALSLVPKVAAGLALGWVVLEVMTVAAAVFALWYFRAPLLKAAKAAVP